MGRHAQYHDPRHVRRRLYVHRCLARKAGKPIPDLPGQSATLARLRSMAITPEELVRAGATAKAGTVLAAKLAAVRMEGGR